MIILELSDSHQIKKKIWVLYLWESRLLLNCFIFGKINVEVSNHLGFYYA